ncbi:MAG: nucleotidyltransferase family protein, partial [Polyangiaceae bacterium]
MEKVRVWSQQELARSALERVVAISERQGIEILPVKGVVSARRYYDDVSERPMQDVDVRVTQSALRHFRTLGPREGLKLIHNSPAYESLGFDVGGMLLEMEAHIGPPGVCTTTIDDLLRRAETHESTFGFRCLEPELHDHALLLVVNAFKDKLVDAMPWALADLARVVREPAFDAKLLAERARAGRVTSLVWVVASFLVARGASDA